MAWLIVLAAILAVIVFVTAMYFNFKELGLEGQAQPIQSQAVDLERLSTMVAEKIISELRALSASTVDKDDFRYNFFHNSNTDGKESNVIDFNSRLRLRNVRN